MCANRYYDDESHESQPAGSDYTDRFRLDSHYDNPPTLRAGSPGLTSSGSLSRPTAIARMVSLIRE
jgi:hypothetical protein